MDYLITGGAGFIGSHLTDRLACRSNGVLVLDDFSSGSSANLSASLHTGCVRVVRGSVLDAELVERCVREVDVCVHLAGTLGVARIVGRPLDALLANARGVDVVMAVASRMGRRMLFASSSEVYGKRSGQALREDSDCTIGAPSRSRWSYAIAKQFGEALVHAYHHDTGADFAAIRFFNVIGPRQSPAYGMVLPRFVAQALAGEPLTVYGDGRQSRCFTSIHDAIDAIEALLESDSTAGRTFNVGTSAAIQINDLAQRVIARADSRSLVAYIPYEQAYEPGYEELGDRAPDTSALRQLTGWAPRRTIDEAIDEMIAANRGEVPPLDNSARATAKLLALQQQPHVNAVTGQP